MKHTETPWRLMHGLHGKPDGLTIWEDKRPAKMIADVCTCHDEAQETAVFIVQACNAHDGLVKALQLTLSGLESGSVKSKPIIDFSDENAESLSMMSLASVIREALAKAKAPS